MAKPPCVIVASMCIASIILIGAACGYDMKSQHSESKCTEFKSTFEKVADILDLQQKVSEAVQNPDTKSPLQKKISDETRKAKNNVGRSAKDLTVTAQFYQTEKDTSIREFSDLSKTCMWKELMEKPKKTEIQGKYRSIDGRGNNRLNPEWGAANTPFGRFGGKNYEDGIYRIKKSVVDGSDLPAPRVLVQELLTKAKISNPPPESYNLMAILLILFVTHDVHFQTPARLEKSDLKCCTRNFRHSLPPHLSHPDCLPIGIPKNDSFFSKGKIGCQSYARSELGRYSDGVETGAILNRATGYLDLSLIYGNIDAEMKAIRLYKGGLLRMDEHNVMPVDKNNEYLSSMERFVSIPISTLWPALFSRNHNLLAKKLAKLNQHWDDEKLFQETRRLNIALFQRNLITVKAIEVVFGQSINETYSEKRQVATTVEFAIAYRGGHYYMPSDVVFEKDDGTKTTMKQSDTIGKLSETVGPNFDEVLQGALNNPPNVGQYSDEMINRIDKNAEGYGVDLVSIDIQRGRDHGTPSFLDIRRQCKLQPEIKTFDDFKQIFQPENVELLKRHYKSPEDVDYYVGGMLEIFASVANPVAGPTFGCVIGENYRNVMGGDIYYYTHPENPNPFTKEQLDQIQTFSMIHLYCLNSKLKQTNANFAFIHASFNPKVDCSSFPLFDLSPWKESNDV